MCVDLCRCSQNLAAQLQSVCSEREEAEQSWLARERQIKGQCKQCVDQLEEKLRVCESERAAQDEVIRNVKKELNNAQQLVEQLRNDLQCKADELRSIHCTYT